MKIETCFIDGLKIIHLDVFEDNRGYFVEKYNQQKFETLGLPMNWIQDNYSFSKKGVIRGLHLQKKPHPQAKLVTCHKGQIIDIVVDVRKGSSTFGQHFATELSEENGKMLFVPAGFAHGFSVLSDEAYVSYKIIGQYNTSCEASINALDKELNLPWNVNKPIISEKDAKAMSFKEFCAKHLDDI
jgi:dTDP-4-dehydrorhamnose 3,5-epimerase